MSSNIIGNNSRSLASNATSVALKTINVNSEKRSLPQQRMKNMTAEEQQKINTIYDELWSKSVSTFEEKRLYGNAVYPVNENGMVTWVGNDTKIYTACPDQFDQMITHFKDTLPPRKCGVTGKCIKHKWVKVYTCFYCHINGCLDGSSCTKLFIMPPTIKPVEAITCPINESFSSITPQVKAEVVKHGYSSAAALPATMSAPITSKPLVKLAKEATRGRLGKMTYSELEEKHHTTTCLNWLRFGHCKYYKTKKGCMHICQGREMTYKKDIRSSVQLLLDTPDAIPFSKFFTEMSAILISGSEQVKFTLKHMLTESTISNSMKIAKRALFNGKLKETDHLVGIFQLWSACFSSSSIPYEIKKVITEVKTKKIVVPKVKTMQQKVRENNKSFITKGDPMAKEGDLDDEALMYVYVRSEEKTIAEKINEITEEGEGESDTESLEIKVEEVVPTESENIATSTDASGNKHDIIPSPFNFSLEGKVTVESTKNIDLIAMELTRRMSLCFLADRMEGKSYRKIYGYGEESILPPRPVKAIIPAPISFQSIKEEEKFKKKLIKAEAKHEEALREYNDRVAFAKQKASLILPPDTRAPTNLYAKSTCSGNEVCRCGAHSRSDVLLFNGMYNIMEDSTLTTLEKKNFEANKLSSEVKRASLEKEYERFILFNYMPAFIADQALKQRKDLTQQQVGDISSAHKSAWEKKGSIEKEIASHFDGEWAKYHKIGKDLVKDYGYTPIIILEVVIKVVPEVVPEVVPDVVLEVVTEVVPEIVHDDFYDNIAPVNSCLDDDEIIIVLTPKQQKEKERKDKLKVIADLKAAEAAEAAEVAKAAAKAAKEAAKAAKAAAKAEGISIPDSSSSKSKSKKNKEAEDNDEEFERAFAEKRRLFKEAEKKSKLKN